MSDWLDLSTVVSTAIGTFIAGLLLLRSAPLWWRKWIKPGDTPKVREAVRTFAGIAVLIGSFVGIFVVVTAVTSYVESASTPRYHPTLTEDEATLAFSECEMQSVKATSDILQKSSRSVARSRYRKACLISKGFRLVLPDSRE